MSDRAGWQSNEARLAILADGSLDAFGAKTAIGLLRYRRDSVVVVVDHANAGRDMLDVVGVGHGVPIVADVQQALAHRPTALIIGVATSGGHVPHGWRTPIRCALEHGVDIVNGLHERIANDAECTRAAAGSGASIHDIRHHHRPLDVGTGRAAHTRACRVLTVGSDCNVGKMVAAMELTRALSARGVDARFAATGQTGIMITGRGICVDAVISDFVAGAAESVVVDLDGGDMIVVEGQGSIVHPGFSGVTLGLMHGALPDAMVLVHDPRRSCMRHTEVPIPPLPLLIDLYQRIMEPLHPSRVVAIALNCHAMNERQAREQIDITEKQLRLPTTDCVRFGADKLCDAALAATA